MKMDGKKGIVNKSREISKIFLLIPALLFVSVLVFFICGIPAVLFAGYDTISENLILVISNIVTEYLVLPFIISLFSPLPCIGAAAVGIGFAIKANKEEGSKSVGLIVAGIIEILVYILYLKFLIYMQSV